MPFCTIVEFEFGAGFGKDQFEAAIGGNGGPTPSVSPSRARRDCRRARCPRRHG